MLVVEVRVHLSRHFQLGHAAVQGGQHTGDGWPVLSRFLFWL